MKEHALEQLTARLRRFVEARDWARFHAPKNLAMALVVEAAELAEHFQWLSEEQSRRLAPERRAQVAEELADILIYLVRLADELGLDLARAVDEKIALNERRYPAERVRGSAKKYTEY